MATTNKLTAKEKKVLANMDEFIIKLVEGVRRPSTLYLSKADYNTFLSLQEKNGNSAQNSTYKGFKVKST